MEVQRPGALHAPTGADASSIFHSVNFDRLNKMMIEPASMARQRACGGQISSNKPMIAVMHPTPMTPIDATLMTIPCFLDLRALHVLRGGDARLRC
jgi:hypothetical protein